MHVPDTYPRPAGTPLPPSSHAKPIDTFGPAKELELELRRVLRGEVRFDAGARAIYASDGSNYRQAPIGVVIPADNDDVIAAMASCRKFGAPVLSRGAGTSLAGQCCNVAVVFDYTKYMNRILEMNPAQHYAWVQPGVVCDTLRDAAEVHQLTWGPDPSTHNRCSLGGMIGNNSCGTHSLLAGKTADNIQELKILLYDGTPLTVGPTGAEELDAIIKTGGRRGEIYGGLRRIRDRYAGLIRSKYPAIPRRVSGYNLEQLLPENGFNVARALVGTEGTCVAVLEAKATLIPSPQYRSLVGLGYRDAFAAADHVSEILALKPIGLEGFEGAMIDGLRRKGAPNLELIPEGRGYLLVEFGADDPATSEQRAPPAYRASQATPGSPEHPSLHKGRGESRVAHSRVRPASRRAAAPAWRLASKDGTMPRLLRTGLAPICGNCGSCWIRTTTRRRTTVTSATAASTCRSASICSPNRESGTTSEFIDRAADLVVKYGGSLSGEHGDGQARGALLPKMFGPELMQAFREFKAVWDPENKMNPHKAAVDPYPPAENLRLGADYKPQDPPTRFAFPDDHGSFAQGFPALYRRRRLPQNDARARCARATWPHSKRNTAREAAPACYGRCFRAKSSRMAGKASRSNRPWTCACPARPANRSVRRTSISRHTAPSSCRTIMKRTRARCRLTHSA